MANSAETNCILSFLLSESKKWSHVDDGAVDREIKNPKFKAKYASRANVIDGIVAKTKYWGDSIHEQLLEDWEDITGISPNNIGSKIRSPNAMLGDDVVNMIRPVYTEFIKKYGMQNEKAWRQTAGKTIEKLEDQIISMVPDHMKDYAYSWLNTQIEHGDLFPPPNVGGLQVRAKNAIGNVVNWNPAIAIANVFEFLPKAYVFSAQNGDMSGLSIMKAMRRYFKDTGLNFAKRVDALEELGVYGQAGGGTILDLTENPLRGLSYYLAEELGLDGFDALEEIAFVPRYGNKPLIFNQAAALDSVALMRFSMSAWKMYSALLNGARKGNTGAIAGLLGFSALTAIQSGGSAAIPVPLALLLDKLDPSIIEELDEWTEESLGFNLAGKMGLDMKEMSRPLPSVALGLGYSIATQDVAGGAVRMATGAADVAHGDVGLGFTNMLEGLLGVALISKYPFANVSTKRLIQTMRTQLEEDGELDPEGYFNDWMVNAKLRQE